jgi:hypothetical protein
MSEILGGLHVHVLLYMRTLRADMGGLNGYFMSIPTLRADVLRADLGFRVMPVHHQ